ncbi:MAG: PglZ domain-containing protein [Candidatus Njordarchaeales archaeon]|mgnify:CR=1 FL=1
MNRDLSEILSRVLESKNICEEIGSFSVLKEYERVFNPVRYIAENLCVKGIANIKAPIRTLKRALGTKSIEIIIKILKRLQDLVGSIEILEIDKEAFFQGGEAVKSYSIEKFRELGARLEENKLLVAISEKFKKNFIVLPKIFEKIFDQDPWGLLATLAIDVRRVFWNRVEHHIIKELDLRPPLETFILLFHASKEHHDLVKGLLLLEEMSRKLGLAIRNWDRSIIALKKIKQFIEMVSNVDEPLKLLIYALNLLIDGGISLKDFFSLLIGFLKMDINWKERVLTSYSCVPSENLLKSLKDMIWDEALIDRVCRNIMNAEKKWAPEITINDLFGISWLSTIRKDFLLKWLSEQLEKANRTIRLSEVIIPEEIMNILRLALVLSMTDTKCNRNTCLLVARSLLALRWRLQNYPISLISLVVSSLKELEEKKLAIGVYLERILEIHGPEAYLYVLDKLFSDEKKKLIVALNIMFSSRIGIVARKIISKAMTKPELLKDVNDILQETAFTPHGITIPMVWELNLPFSPRLLEITENAIRYFSEVEEQPPRLLILFRECLEAFNEVRKVKSILKGENIIKYINNCPKILTGRTALQTLIRELRRIFGNSEARLIRLMIHELNSIYETFSEKWERIFLMNYPEIINETSKLPSIWRLPKIIKEYLRLAPVILLVIDGLRYDDYIIKLRPALMDRGLVPMREEAMLSLLPSVTTVSRRAIFGGLIATRYFSQFSNVINLKILREDELLKMVITSDSVYLHGAIARILKKIKELVKEGRKTSLMAIVISELEKAAHGAAEGFLAHLTTDYVNEILRVIRAAAQAIHSTTGNMPYLILTADHGLELFTKATEIDTQEIIKKLQKTRMLDPAHEPLLSERFSIFAFLNDKAAKEAKEMILLQYGDKLFAVTGKELGYEKVALKLRDQDLADAVPSQNTLFIFPRKKTKFVWERRKITRIVLHGGLSPIETIVPFAVFRFKEVPP